MITRVRVAHDTPFWLAGLLFPYWFYTTKSHGLGLGLAISRRIVEAHGGRLWASANVPHGAVFQFTLPRGSEEGA